ncbi:MAG: Gx transporter family protein [Clostridia bacterium]|nr:Gx transporter family protein [Clostridia bacterium]
MKSTRRLVLLALLVSQALILSVVESWIPIPIPIPGVKLGLANIITLVTIIFFGYREALLVVLVRCLLSSMFGGGFVIFLFSMAGGILSTLVMAFLYNKISRVFSIVGVSIAGAVMHNVGQLAVASVFMKDLSVMYYLPVLLVSGVIMGCFVGICSKLLVSALQRSKALQ